MDISLIILRTLFIYFFVLLAMRIMGKREIGKLSIFDLVVSIMIAELAVIAIEQFQEPIYYSVLPITILVITQVVIAYLSLKSQKVRNIVDGKPSIIVANGKIKEDEMRKQRYNLDDLLLQLRANKIHNLSQVEFAILEPSGRLTVIPKEEDEPITKKDLGLGHIGGKQNSPIHLPKILIKDGEIQEKALEEIGRNIFWLKKELKRQVGTSDPKDISICTLSGEGSWYIDLIDKK